MLQDASNHVSGFSEYLHNLQSYHDNQNIQIVDDNTLSITNVGDINHDFRDVLVSPGISSNLLFVGQSCVVLEQVLGKVIANGA